ncbi:unnamed protein product, partial [Menidia menidia]
REGEFRLEGKERVESGDEYREQKTREPLPQHSSWAWLHSRFPSTGGSEQGRRSETQFGTDIVNYRLGSAALPSATLLGVSSPDNELMEGFSESLQRFQKGSAERGVSEGIQTTAWSIQDGGRGTGQMVSAQVLVLKMSSDELQVCLTLMDTIFGPTESSKICHGRAEQKQKEDERRLGQLDRDGAGGQDEEARVEWSSFGRRKVQRSLGRKEQRRLEMRARLDRGAATICSEGAAETATFRLQPPPRLKSKKCTVAICLPPPSFASSNAGRPRPFPGRTPPSCGRSLELHPRGGA